MEKGETLNPKGRPRKFVSELTALGYKNSEAIDCLKNLLALTEGELKSVASAPNATALEKIMAKAMLNDLKNKTFHTFQPIIDRVFGKPAQTLDIGNKDGEAFQMNTTVLIQGVSGKDKPDDGSTENNSGSR